MDRVRIVRDSHGTQYELGERRARVIRTNHPREPGVYALFFQDGHYLTGLSLAEAEGRAILYCRTGDTEG